MGDMITGTNREARITKGRGPITPPLPWGPHYGGQSGISVDRVRSKQQIKTEAERELLVHATDRLRRGDLEGARDDFSAALEINPGSLIALVNRGSLRYLLGDTAGALADLTAAIRLDPACDLAHFDRGVIHLELADFGPAERDFGRIVSCGRADAEVYTNRGIARYGLGQLEAALDDFDRAVERDSGALLARFYRARMSDQHGNIDRALEDVNICLSRAPPDSPLWAAAQLVRRSITRRLAS
jgi:tetratricopeptide (TPR) repeat protein